MLIKWGQLYYSMLHVCNKYPTSADPSWSAIQIPKTSAVLNLVSEPPPHEWAGFGRKALKLANKFMKLINMNVKEDVQFQ